VKVIQKARNAARGFIQRHGPEFLKRRQWNQEFSSGRWNCLDNTGDDRVHLLIENYSNKGNILDLGCGSGTTSIEVNAGEYAWYMGVDISDVAIQKARKRAEESGRLNQNEYFQSDILTYTPGRKCDVILFGDSIYYVPQRRIVPMLARYAEHLTDRGVFIARLFEVRGKGQIIVDTIKANFDVLETNIADESQALVIVFRPIADTRTKIPESRH
jgi:SAM-dependent methyltransferase